MRDRQSVGAMLAEVAGKKAADTVITGKLKNTKAALAKVAAGARTGAPAGWPSPYRPLTAIAAPVRAGAAMRSY
jgi:hypothetical protein